MKNYLQNVIKKVFLSTLSVVALSLIGTTINAQCGTQITDLDGDGKDYVCAGSSTYYEAVREGAAIGSTISMTLSGGGSIVLSSENGTTRGITIDWDDTPDSGPYYLTLTENNTGCTSNDVIEIYIEKNNLNMVCNDLVLIALDNNCRDTISPDEILEAPLYPDASYDVTVFNTDLTPRTEPIASIQDLGDTLMVVVRHSCTGLACMGRVSFQDKLASMLTCKPDTIELECNESTDPENPVVGFPLVPGSTVQKIDEYKYKALIPGDCGGEFTLVYYDDIEEYPCDSTLQLLITRTWAAIDASNNEWQCSELISVKWADFDSVCAPPHYDGMNGRKFFECNNNPSDTNSIYWPFSDSIPGPEITGYPDYADCSNIQFLYQDTELSICGYSKKIIRQWIILDWCTGRQKSCDQILSFVDNKAPYFRLPLGILEFENKKDKCFGSAFPLPEPASVIECSDWDYKVLGYKSLSSGSCSNLNGILTDGLFENNGRFGIENLTVDSVYCVIYELTDDCNQSSYGSIRVVIRDTQAPTAACESHTVITLGTNAEFPATSLDDHSWDNCGIEKLEIKRTVNRCGHHEDLIFGEFVNICCNDVGEDVMVILRATDKSGLTNECMGWVRVDDKDRPVLTSCPEDFTVNCTDDYANIFTGGKPTATDNCSNVIVRKIDIPSLNDCGIGYITRIWTLKDHGALETLEKCTQRITVIDPNPLTPDNIVWPDDITVSGCWPDVDIDEAITGLPIPLNGDYSCKDLGIGHTDLVIFNSENNDECVVIYRTFTVGDWCRPNMEYIEYVQKIYVNDGGAPYFTNCTSDTLVYTGEACTADVLISAYANDDCTPEVHLKYTYTVDKGNDGTIDKTGFGNSVYTTFDRGNNKVEFSVIDACGNTATCTRIVRVKDSKPPTPLCLRNLTTSLGTVGSVTLNANMFDHGSTDNCTPSNMGVCGCLTELRFSFSEDVNDSLITYTCDSLVNGVGQSFELYVHVTDLDDNNDYCIVKLIILDTKDICPDAPNPTFAVQGMIMDENNEGLPGFEVKGKVLNENDENISETNINGNYFLSSLGAYNQYEIIPVKNDDPLDGLTTLDLVLIQKHILDIQKFDTPFKYLAADANNTSSISASDLLELRKLILGSINELTTKESWKFLKANSEFANPNNPWYYDNKYITDSLLFGLDSLDFIAVKIGDVNHSANAYNSNSMIESRNLDLTYFNADDITFNRNELIPIDIKLEESENLAGFQFTLEFDAEVLEFVSIDNKIINLSSANVNTSRASNGLVTFSWNNSNGMSIDGQEKLFTLNFKSKSNGILSEIISISSEITKSELYNKELEISKLELRFTGDKLDIFNVHQNRPNPFSNSTEILFNLPNDSNVRLKILDSTGRIIKKTHRHYSKGQNSISILGSELNEPGVYFYELTTEKSSVVKRMIFIK